MTTKRPPGLFIAGTNTGVGKTYVTAMIARQLLAKGVRVGVYKPVLSGFATDLAQCSDEELRASQDDDVVLWQAAGRPGELGRVCPQRFRAPTAAPLAARAEGSAIDSRLLRKGVEYWRERSDMLLVEGAGGLMSPMTDDEYVADVALDLGYPLIIVTRNEIGVINQTLQTLITAATFREGLRVAGIVLNHPHPLQPATDPSVVGNRRELEKRCRPPLLAELDWQALDFNPPPDWLQVAARCG